MTIFPSEVQEFLNSPLYKRACSKNVKLAFKKLEIVHESAQDFFELFEGSFWSEHLGCELLDICTGDENILSVTEICRKNFRFPSQFLILTRFSVSIMVLDCVKDKVYEIDFEGGDALLINQMLPPRWDSFLSFINEYFTGKILPT